VQVNGIQLFARSSRKTGMNVQIGDKAHRKTFVGVPRETGGDRWLAAWIPVREAITRIRYGTAMSC
jgi:hypothetical protein